MPYYDIDKIDEYLSGRMKGKTLISFEQQLQNDADLQKAVQERKELLVAVNALGDIHMKERAKRIHKIATGSSTKIRRIPLWRYAAAAVVFLAICFGIWFWLQPSSPTDLYVNYYEPYTLSFSTRDLTADQQLSQASELYKKGDFENTLPVLEELLTKDVRNKDRIRLAAGICQMELNNDGEALSYFQNLINNTSSPYNEQGLWYAGLLSLRSEDVSAAKQFLQQLTLDADSFKAEEAKKILSRLE